MTEFMFRNRATIAIASRVDRTAARHVLIGNSPAMARLRDIVTRVAPSQAPVIITGPSGSGKEAAARAIHAGSDRAARPFVAINCGALSSELIESELFGHEKGAFTGAGARRIGRFEEADGGTLFLDEIGEMRPDMQVKLLRVLEDGVVHRVGGGPVVHVDVRIIAATHRDVSAEVDAGRFREDLYFRLGVLLVQTPSLAERPADISELIDHLQAGPKCAGQVQFDDSALARLERHDWPGNVRELRNVIERAGVLYAGSTLTAAEVDHLLGSEPVPVVCHLNGAMPTLGAPVGRKPVTIDLKTLMEEVERQHIGSALDASAGVVAEAARLLTLKRTTLIEKMRKYGLIVGGGDPAMTQAPRPAERRPRRKLGSFPRQCGGRRALATLKVPCNSYVTSVPPPLSSTFLHNGYVTQSIVAGVEV